MPCSVSREEELWYEQDANHKLYGIRDVDRRISQRVACEMAQLIEALGASDQLSKVAAKWIEHHKAEDASRREAELRKKTEER